VEGSIVVMEGLPGAGKSTICGMFADRGAVVFHEVLDANNHILSHEEINAEDTEFFLLNDLRKYLKAREARLVGRVAVVDRGMESTLAYSRLLDRKDGTRKFQEARLFYKQHHKIFSSADMTVYLDLPPAMSASRKKPVIEEGDLWSFPENLVATRQYYLSVFRGRSDVVHLSGIDSPEVNFRRLLSAVAMKEDEPTCDM
jgi:thymidylate kinase